MCSVIDSRYILYQYLEFLKFYTFLSSLERVIQCVVLCSLFSIKYGKKISMISQMIEISYISTRDDRGHRSRIWICFSSLDMKQFTRYFSHSIISYHAVAASRLSILCVMSVVRDFLKCFFLSI